MIVKVYVFLNSEGNTTEILSEALNFAKLVSNIDIEWAFVGGVAVGIYGFIRATEDIDILIRPDDLSKLDPILEQNGFIINKKPVHFKDGFSLYRRIKVIDDEYFILDVMTAPENFLDLLKNRQAGMINGYKVFVITKADLIRMKHLSGRLKDQMDIEELEKI